MTQKIKQLLKLTARIIVLSLLIYLSVGILNDARAQTRSLDYFLTRAIEDSPIIMAQRNSADSARLQQKMVTADLNRPYLSATGDYMYAPYSNHWGYDPAITDGGHYAALLNADYPIFTGSKKDARIHATSVAIRQSENQIKQRKHNLKQSVTDQYITAYQDLMQVRYLDDIRALLSQQKQITQSLADEGVARITDVKQLNIELQSNRISRESAMNTYQQDLLQLNTLAGIADTATTVRLQQPAIDIGDQITGQSDFMTRFKLDSLDIAVQQRLSELKYQPTINLYGNTGLNAVKFTGIQNRFGYSVGMNVSVPIFDGGQRSLTQQQSRLQQKSVDAYRQRFRTNRRLRLEGIRNQMHRKAEQLNLIQQQITHYEDLLKDNRKELVQGIISVTEYLTILRSYADTRQQRVQLKSEQIKLKNKYRYWNW